MPAQNIAVAASTPLAAQAAPRAEAPAGDLFSTLVGLVDANAAAEPAKSPATKAPAPVKAKGEPAAKASDSRTGEDEASKSDDSASLSDEAGELNRHAEAAAAPEAGLSVTLPLAAAAVTVGEPTSEQVDPALSEPTSAVSAQTDAAAMTVDPDVASLAAPLEAAPDEAGVSPAALKAQAQSPQAPPPKAEAPVPAAVPAPPIDVSAATPAPAAVAEATPQIQALAGEVAATSQAPRPTPPSSAPIKLTAKSVAAAPGSASAGTSAVDAPTAGLAEAVITADAVEAAPQADGSLDAEIGFGMAEAEAPVETADADTSSTPFSALLSSSPRESAAPAVATSGTVSHLAAQIVRRVDGRTSRFDIELDPDGLGRVAVQIKIDAQGRLSATLAFDRPESAEALKARAGELRQALQDSGFDLSGSSLSFESSAGGQFADGAWTGREAQSDARGRAFGASAAAAQLADQATATRQSAARGLDIRI